MPPDPPLVDRLAAYLCDDQPAPCVDCVTMAGRALRFLANNGPGDVDFDAPLYVVDDGVRCNQEGCCQGGYLSLPRRTTPREIAEAVTAHLLDRDRAR